MTTAPTPSEQVKTHLGEKIAAWAIVLMVVYLVIAQ